MKSKLVFLFIVVVLLGLGAVIRFPNSGERRGLVNLLISIVCAAASALTNSENSKVFKRLQFIHSSVP